MDISENIFHRLFSMSMYKTHKLHLGKLSFTKDFITNSHRGDLYPSIDQSSDTKEYIEDNRYVLKGGSVKRLMGQFFPFATYEISFNLSNGYTGFSFNINNAQADIYYDNSSICFVEDNKKEIFPLMEKISTLIVTCRPGAFDVYTLKNSSAYFLKSFNSEAFKNSNVYNNFTAWMCLFFQDTDRRIPGLSKFLNGMWKKALKRPGLSMSWRA